MNKLYGKKKVIIVEDDNVTRKKIALIVEKLGFNIIAEFSRINTKKILSCANDADLILLDINLPGEINGVDFAERIRGECDVPIIFVSATDDQIQIERAFKSNIYGFIKKPFSSSDVEMALRILDVRKSYEAKTSSSPTTRDEAYRLEEHAGSLIHDLNNFTTVISTSLETIDLLIQKYEETNELDLDIFKRSIQNGYQGVGKLTQISERYRKVFFDQKDEPVNQFELKDMVDDLVRIFSRRCRDSNIEIIVENQGDNPISTKEITLLQVLVNMISNSLYEIEHKNLSDRWIKISCIVDKNHCVIQLKDSGEGIEGYVAARIFEKGFSTKKRNEQEGAGVGLSLVKESIERDLKGSIWYLQDEKNTTFEIIIPQLEMSLLCLVYGLE